MANSKVPDFQESISPTTRSISVAITSRIVSGVVLPMRTKI